MFESVKTIVVLFILSFLAFAVPATAQSQNSEVVVVPSPRRPRGDVKVPVIRPQPEPGVVGAAADATVSRARTMEIVIPAGTGLDVRMVRELTSKTALTGDLFEALLDRDFTVDGETVIPRGSLLTGHLDEVEAGGKVKGRAHMILELTFLQLGEERYPLETGTIEIQAGSSKGKDARTVGIAAGLGALIGAVAGGKKGAAIGATIGGGAGSAKVLTSKGKAAVVEAEQFLTFRLEQDATVVVRR